MPHCCGLQHATGFRTAPPGSAGPQAMGGLGTAPPGSAGPQAMGGLGTAPAGSAGASCMPCHVAPPGSVGAVPGPAETACSSGCSRDCHTTSHAHGRPWRSYRVWHHSHMYPCPVHFAPLALNPSQFWLRIALTLTALSTPFCIPARGMPCDSKIPLVIYMSLLLKTENSTDYICIAAHMMNLFPQ